MGENIISKIKKYLFFISIVFFVTTGSHLIYKYLYNGADEIPMEGGTISEGIIGSMPHLNPLLPSSDYNKYINSILYRSLLSYDIVNEKVDADLASCDVSNLSLIECYLENNLLWSDGNPITSEDIVATLNLIEKTNINPGISALLENTTIEVSGNKITFNNRKKDINFLNIFFQPILSKNIIDSLSEAEIKGNFSPVGGVYSGRYTLSSVHQDETVGITRMTLSKNENYFQNTAFLDTIILKVFKDNSHFLKHKNSVNIFKDPENIVGGSIPRLQSQEYVLPQFVGVFLNQETISKSELRKKILSGISRNTIIEEIGIEKVKEEKNPFLSDENIDRDSTESFQNLITQNGYYSKIDLIKKTLDLPQPKEEKISDEITPSEPKITQEELSYITSPTKVKYNFVSEDNILLKGNVPENTQAVYVNEYQLQGFTPEDDVFYYRLLESYDSIKAGENIYKIYFEGIDGEKKLSEEIVYIYDTNTETLQITQENFFNEEETTEIVSLDDKTEDKAEEPTEIKEKEVVNIDVDSLDNLDERFFYTLDGDAFKIRLAYVNTDANIDITAQSIKQQLEQEGIFVELIPLSLVDITRGLRDDSLEYDAILIGINLGYFDSNIFPYFHSSQVKNGYNFANYKQLGLDILLEELKSNNLTNTKKSQLENKVLEELQEASIIKVFYRPKANLLVDQNLQGFKIPENIPDEVHRFDPLLKTYMTKKKILNTSEKSILGFGKYLFQSLF